MTYNVLKTSIGEYFLGNKNLYEICLNLTQRPILYKQSNLNQLGRNER